MSDFFKKLITETGLEYTSMANSGEGAGEFSGYIDTGCYMLNAVLSGSLYGGASNNKITAFAGESSTGKTFFVLGIMKYFLDNNPNAGAVYYDTEAAVTKDMMEARGIDTSRVIYAEPESVQSFRFHALKMLETYMATPKKDRPPMLFILDSLGMLPTTKELEDTAEGKETRDMTRAQTIRSTFRVLTLKLARAKVPMLITNHTYEVVGAYIPTKAMSGGGGLRFAASSIAFLSKKKDKDGTDVVGNLITIKMDKSRMSKENSQATVRLSYDTGLDRYYGLLELAEAGNVFKKVSTRYELPDGTKVFGKAIIENPEKYFTPEIMAQLEVVANKMYSYGHEDGQIDDEEYDIDEEVIDEA